MSRTRADSSHIARRRFTSAPALDIEIDEVDFFDDPSSPALALTQPAGKSAEPARSPPHRVHGRRVTKRARWLFSWPILLGLALFAIGVGAAAGLAARARDAHRRALAPAPPPTLPSALATTSPLIPTPAAPPVVTPAASAAVPPTAQLVPVVDVANLPRPHDGVVTGSPGHRLWIDGTLAPSWKVTLPCGPHVVQVGSAGATRTVEVPCGSAVMVSP